MPRTLPGDLVLKGFRVKETSKNIFQADKPSQSFIVKRFKGQRTTSSFIPKTIVLDRQGNFKKEVNRSIGTKGVKNPKKFVFESNVTTFKPHGVKVVERFGEAGGKVRLDKKFTFSKGRLVSRQRGSFRSEVERTREQQRQKKESSKFGTREKVFFLNKQTGTYSTTKISGQKGITVQERFRKTPLSPREKRKLQRESEIRRIKQFNANRNRAIGRDKEGRVTIASKGLESLVGTKLSGQLAKNITTGKISAQQLRNAKALGNLQQKARFGGVIFDNDIIMEATFPKGHPKAGQTVTFKADPNVLRKLEGKLNPSQRKNIKKVSKEKAKSIEEKPQVKDKLKKVTFTSILKAGFIPTVSAAPVVTRDTKVKNVLSDLDNISKGKVPKHSKELAPKEVGLREYLRIGSKLNKKQLQGKSSIQMANVIFKEIKAFPESILKGYVKASVFADKLQREKNIVKKIKEGKFTAREFGLALSSNLINTSGGNPILPVPFKLFKSTDKDIKNFKRATILAATAAAFGTTIAAIAAIGVVSSTLVTTGLILASPFVANSIAKDWARRSAQRGIIQGTTESLVELGIFTAGSRGAKLVGKSITKKVKTSKGLSKVFNRAKVEINKIKMPKFQRKVLLNKLNKGFNKAKQLFKKEKATELKELRRRIAVKRKLDPLRNKAKSMVPGKEKSKLLKRISKLNRELNKKPKTVIELRPEVIKKQKLKIRKVKAKKVSTIKSKISKNIIKRKKAIRQTTKKKLTKDIIKLNKELQQNINKKPQKKYKFKDPFTGKERLFTKKEFITASREVAGIGRRKGVRTDLIRNFQLATKKWLKPIKTQRGLTRSQLNKVRISIARQTALESRLRRGLTPKAPRKGTFFGEITLLNGRKVPKGTKDSKTFFKIFIWIFKDKKTGEFTYFTKRVNWLKAVKAQVGKTKPRPDLLKFLDSEKARISRAQRTFRKRTGIKQALQTNNKFTNVQKNKVKNVVKGNRRVVKSGRHQLVTEQRTKTTKLKGEIKNKLKTTKTKYKKGLNQITKLKTKPPKTFVGTLTKLGEAVVLYGLYLSLLNKQTQALSLVGLSKTKQAQATAQIQQQAQATAQASALDLGRLSIVIPAAAIATVFLTQTILRQGLLSKFIPFSEKGKQTMLGARGSFSFKFTKPPIENRFIFLSDLQSKVFGLKATKKEKRELLTVGRVFTGIEKRKLLK